MQFEIERLQLSFDAYFRQPAFDVSISLATVAREVHRSFAASFGVRLSDITSLPGGNLGEVGLRIAVPAVSAEVELRLDRANCRFSGIGAGHQLDSAKKLIAGLHEAVPVALPGAEIGASVFKVSSWIRCEGGAGVAHALLDAAARPAQPIDASALGASSISYGLKFDLENASEAWRAAVVIERSLIQRSDLFVLLDLGFLDAPGAEEPASRIAKAEAIYLGILGRFGLQPKTLGTNA